MYQTLIQRYENGCLMLMDHREDGYHFLGTAFIAHAQGYLFTAAHLLARARNLVVVNPAQPGVFSPLHAEDSGSLPVGVVRTDPERDIALLKMELDTPVDCPDDFIGNPDSLKEGTYLLCMGISFGHLRIHNVMVMRGMISAKIVSPNQTHLLLIDRLVHPGDIGGPIVNVEDGRIAGVVLGVFDPLQIQALDAPKDYHINSGFSHAASIEYGRALLDAEGLATSAAPTM